MEGIGGFPESGPENPLGVRGRNTFSIPQTALQLQREFHTVGVWRRYSVHKDTHSGYQGRGILNLSLPHGNALSCCFSILLYLFEIKRKTFQRAVSWRRPCIKHFFTIYHPAYGSPPTFARVRTRASPRNPGGLPCANQKDAAYPLLHTSLSDCSMICIFSKNGVTCPVRFPADNIQR